jgi:S-adenosylmethionine decarboxylase
MKNKTKRSIQWVPKNRKAKYAGIHLIAEFWRGKIIEDRKEIKRILIVATKKGNNTPLDITVHKFSPQGLTGVVLLVESHIAIHTWPEYRYAAVDVFTCGSNVDPEKAAKLITERLGAQSHSLIELRRGIMEDSQVGCTK